MRLGRTLVSAPSEEPVTLEEAKLAAQVDHSDEDALITAYIVAARELLEQATGRQFVTATWDIFTDVFPAAGVLELPFAPVQSITHVKYYDTDGALQTLDAAVYVLDTTQAPGRFYLDYAQSWPALREIRNAVQLRLVAGYGAAADVPEALKAAIKFTISHWLDNPGCTELPPAATAIAHNYCVEFPA